MAFWTLFFTVIIAAFTIMIAVAPYFVLTDKRSISYGMTMSAPLMLTSPGAASDLRVLHGDDELANPHILNIRLSCRGRRDIPSDAYDQGMPLRINVGVPIVAVLEASSVPPGALLPEVVTEGPELRVGPSLIRKGQVLAFAVLTDGPGGRLTDQSPLIDVAVRPEIRAQARRAWRMRFLTCSLAIFIIYYATTEPVAAAHSIRGIWNAIHALGNGLATWVNSL